MLPSTPDERRCLTRTGHLCVFVPSILAPVHLGVLLLYVHLFNTGGGKHWGLFLVLFYFVFPHLLPAVIAFIFIASRVPASLALVNRKVEVCLLPSFQLFRFTTSMQICKTFHPYRDSISHFC